MEIETFVEHVSKLLGYTPAPILFKIGVARYKKELRKKQIRERHKLFLENLNK